MENTLAVVAVLALSAPAAVGVYRALEPTRGAGAAGLAALGIELAYLSLALLTLSAELRAHARAVALSAVGTSISLNVLADYSARVPGGLTSWPQAVARFDPLALGLAVVESAPLAGLAFALASLLHRLAEAHDAPDASGESDEPTPTWAGGVLVATPSASYARVAPQPVYPAPVRVERTPDVSGSDAVNRPAEAQNGAEEAFYRAGTRKTAPPAAPAYSCKRCGLEGLTFAELGRHSRACTGD